MKFPLRRVPHFKNQNPARGRKLVCESVEAFVFVAFKNQNPARGRKRESATLLIMGFMIILRTRTPQGDGNVSHLVALLLRTRILRTRTPQGDGNVVIDDLNRLCLFYFKNQNPARGRKPVEIHFIRQLEPDFKNQNPARGRKLFRVRCYAAYIALF